MEKGSNVLGTEDKMYMPLGKNFFGKVISRGYYQAEHSTKEATNFGTCSSLS
jgi:hypothetical protein